MDCKRMCVVCREMKDKKNLTRVVKNKDGQIFIDSSGKANGRGAYVCDSPECRKKLIKSKMLNKAFKCTVPDEIYQILTKGE